MKLLTSVLILTSCIATSAIASDLVGFASDNNILNGTATVRFACSGSVFKLATSKSTDKALVLTAGHCVGMGSTIIKVSPIKSIFPSPGEKLKNIPVDIDVDVLKMLGLPFLHLKAVNLVFASMTGTDLAIYELNASYAKLEQYGVKSFKLPTKKPVLVPGLELTVSSGLAMEGGNTVLESIVPEIRELPYTYMNSLRLKPIEKIEHGASGSPVYLAKSRELVGVLNTMNDASDKACSGNNPCEVSSDDILSAPQNTLYAQDVLVINSCVNALGKFDFDQPSCAL